MYKDAYSRPGFNQAVMLKQKEDENVSDEDFVKNSIEALLERSLKKAYETSGVQFGLDLQRNVIKSILES